MKRTLSQDLFRSAETPSASFATTHVTTNGNPGNSLTMRLPVNTIWDGIFSQNPVPVDVFANQHDIRLAAQRKLPGM